jgi:hypothetical protein
MIARILVEHVAEAPKNVLEGSALIEDSCLLRIGKGSESNLEEKKGAKPVFDLSFQYRGASSSF